MYVSWNPSSALATSSLSAAQSSLQRTQQQTATGKSVNDASDNPALWAMATANYSKAGALSAMTSGQQGVALPLASATQSAIGAISGVLNDMRNNLVALQGGGDQNAILQSQQAQGQALNSAVSSAGLNGMNLLDASSAPNGSSFLLAYNEWSGGAQTMSVNIGAASLIDHSGSTGVFQTAKAAGSSQATAISPPSPPTMSAPPISRRP
jgi:flagellin